MKKILGVLIPILVGISFYFGINTYLDMQINQYMKEKNIDEISINAGDVLKDKGTIFTGYFVNNDGLIIQGSSELTANFDQMPTKIFPTKELSKNIEIIGRGYVQNLQHTSIIGSINFDEGINSNIVNLQSFQWYNTYSGIGDKNFQSTFSPVQYYKYINNDKISKSNKIKYTKRVNSLLHGSKQYLPEYLNSKIYSNNDFISKAVRFLLKPYFSLREKVVELKEKGELYSRIKKLDNANKPIIKDINWEKEEEKAEDQGRIAITNNDFGIIDDTFNTIQPKLDELKGASRDIDYTLSKEFEDFELYLDTCIDLEVKPYIILVPTNGKWYDFAGSLPEEREKFYEKAEKMAEEKGFKVLNLFDDEYTEYFMMDTQHLGWKGWLKIDKEINEYFK
ncbi:MAG: D-alanyl-lipoteichoic acid biosynthesis protein DltD [Clostridiales bacterium]|nr:D-alanyl-lipoteichoic acid biosynthesis protein DltD [Clostridiales bacterium]